MIVTLNNENNRNANIEKYYVHGTGTIGIWNLLHLLLNSIWILPYSQRYQLFA